MGNNIPVKVRWAHISSWSISNFPWIDILILISFVLIRILVDGVNNSVVVVVDRSNIVVVVALIGVVFVGVESETNSC